MVRPNSRTELMTASSAEVARRSCSSAPEMPDVGIKRATCQDSSVIERPAHLSRMWTPEASAGLPLRPNAGQNPPPRPRYGAICGVDPPTTAHRRGRAQVQVHHPYSATQNLALRCLELFISKDPLGTELSEGLDLLCSTRDGPATSASIWRRGVPQHGGRKAGCPLLGILCQLAQRETKHATQAVMMNRSIPLASSGAGVGNGKTT